MDRHLRDIDCRNACDEREEDRMKALEEDIIFCQSCWEKMLPGTGATCVVCNAEICQDCTDVNIIMCEDCENDSAKAPNS